MSAGSTTTVVVMGVSGGGKTTVAEGIAAARGWAFAEGDEFHSPANVAKMASGTPLTDEDRWPWLRSIAAWIAAREEAGESVVVTCSALKRAYRDLLARDNPSVVFCELEVPTEVLAQRLAQREGHYMPASLLRSQLDTLEGLQPDERGFRVPVRGGPDRVLAEVLSRVPA
ncbi:gluconokinase [Kineococcus radiotolerans]|uniref:Gluconokinase n=1 Tax=Kineococcus radiotolerans (strain ATCC BAA-149 / DSM 14245 / SRS30216) TaxID=266940 RepID=A6W5J7_KINRD|nr:gluconokinase [Kineococcus radiotolerans]ABS02086.1 carbohydrate kinase, thermoresistant glucokinase family [Kineococcus radiotolerans SRS30216 = ATCC BAA-149]